MGAIAKSNPFDGVWEPAIGVKLEPENESAFVLLLAVEGWAGRASRRSKRSRLPPFPAADD